LDVEAIETAYTPRGGPSPCVLRRSPSSAARGRWGPRHTRVSECATPWCARTVSADEDAMATRQFELMSSEPKKLTVAWIITRRRQGLRAGPTSAA
jgi:hypothetical protein